MEIEQNTKEINNKDHKSEINSKDIPRHIISSQSANQLSKDLIMQRGIFNISY